MAQPTDLELALEMIRDYEKLLGEDPFSPHESGTDFTNQITDYRCWGCSAEGQARWPDWKIKLEHKPNCKWRAYRRVVLGLEVAR